MKAAEPMEHRGISHTRSDGSDMVRLAPNLGGFRLVPSETALGLRRSTRSRRSSWNAARTKRRDRLLQLLQPLIPLIRPLIPSPSPLDWAPKRLELGALPDGERLLQGGHDSALGGRGRALSGGPF